MLISCSPNGRPVLRNSSKAAEYDIFHICSIFFIRMVIFNNILISLRKRIHILGLISERSISRQRKQLLWRWKNTRWTIRMLKLLTITIIRWIALILPIIRRLRNLILSRLIILVPICGISRCNIVLRRQKIVNKLIRLWNILVHKILAILITRHILGWNLIFLLPRFIGPSIGRRFRIRSTSLGLLLQKISLIA